MKSQLSLIGCLIFCAAICSGSASASTTTIGPMGIDSAGLTLATGMPLNGSGVSIGQVELTRPGWSEDDGGIDDAAHSSRDVVPTNVLRRTTDGDAIADMYIDDHAEQVASILIGSDTTDPDGGGPRSAPTGVALGVDLYSSATDPGPPPAPFDVEAALTINHIATLPGVEVRAINMSFGNPSETLVFDGNQHLTQFVDWSALTHDVLYIVAGNQGIFAATPIPKDNYNGITVAFSTIQDGKYGRVSVGNNYGRDAEGVRTSIGLLAPGDTVDVTALNAVVTDDGTSLAAPHVTGTVALLQQYADERIMNVGGPQWKPSPNANARRHEVMKVVLLNSADKLEDNGDGMRLGMSRTVLKMDGSSTWLNSDAYNPTSQLANADSIPLDLEMGAGHLNASRALQQFSPGEHDATVATGTVVPQIGWDYGNTLVPGGSYNEYEFADPLPAGSFVSITLAWDRQVAFDTDADMDGEYDGGDTFENVGFNDLDIYLLPQDATTTLEAVARSASVDSNLEHLFFQIPTTGMYEFWAYEFDSSIEIGTDYAVAWWAFNGPTGPGMSGDYTGDSIVDINDYNLWHSNFGSTAVLDADGNDDEIINAADYVIWRDNLGAGSGSGTLAAVPEPTAAMLHHNGGSRFPLA